MAGNHRVRGTIKFIVWTALSVAVCVYFWSEYYNGNLQRQYYYKAKMAGWAVHADAFKDASKEKPAILEIGTFDKIEGLQAVPVKKGDRLPLGTNGIIDEKTVKEGKRVTLEGNTLKVTVPWQIKESKGFKFRDTFMHKGIETDPMGAVEALLFIIALGFCLGSMAEGFTDMIGMKIEKIKHYEGAH
ncbi:MAG: hypothetical protein AB1473_04120 [Thermodesulfobacteriota bacterium]